MTNLNATPGTCPTCKGQGVCQECHGDSATMTLYGKTQVKYTYSSKHVNGVNTALSAEEYAERNDPAKRKPCEACGSTGNCSQCGITGKILIPN